MEKITDFLRIYIAKKGRLFRTRLHTKSKKGKSAPAMIERSF